MPSGSGNTPYFDVPRSPRPNSTLEPTFSSPYATAQEGAVVNVPPSPRFTQGQSHGRKLSIGGFREEPRTPGGRIWKAITDTVGGGNQLQQQQQQHRDLPSYRRFDQQRQPPPPAGRGIFFKIILRPLYILGRRGPLPTLVGFLCCLTIYIILFPGEGYETQPVEGKWNVNRNGVGAKTVKKPKTGLAALRENGNGLVGNVKQWVAGVQQQDKPEPARGVRKAEVGAKAAGGGRVKPKKKTVVIDGDEVEVEDDAVDEEEEEVPIEEVEEEEEVQFRKAIKRPKKAVEDEEEEEEEEVQVRKVIKKPKKVKSSKTFPLTSRRDGRILIKEGKVHPIPALMERAKERWEKLKSSQSRNFKEAVREYKKRYGRNPPKGFDKWLVVFLLSFRERRNS